MPLLLVTGKPIAPSGHTIASAYLTIRFDEPYSDGTQVYPTVYEAMFTPTQSAWRPADGLAGAPFNIPGGADGYPKPPVAFITEKQVLDDASVVTSTWKQRIIESSSGEWAYGTPPENVEYVSQADLPATYLQPGDNADTLGSGAATDGQVLTADGSGGAAWEDPVGGGVSAGIVTVSSNTTLQASHDGKTLRVTGTVTITLPPGLDTAFQCTILNVGSGVVDFNLGSGVTTIPTTPPELDNTGDAEATVAWVQHAGSDVFDVIADAAEPVTLMLALSDETSDLTVGTALTFRMPYAMVVEDVRINTTTAPTGQALIVDVNEAGVSVFSTRPSIDVGEETSVTATTPPVLSDTSWADDAKMSVDIDQVGSTVAGAGLKLHVYGYRSA